MLGKQVVVLGTLLALYAAAPIPDEEPQISPLCASRHHVAEVESLLQYSLNFARLEGASFSFEECHRMVDALEGFCRVNDHSSFHSDRDFYVMCASYTASLAHNYTSLDLQCEVFFDLVKDLYCPLDPCTQITTEINKAPNALCGILVAATQKEEEKVVAAQAVAENHTVVTPLKCAKYVSTVLTRCFDSFEDPTNTTIHTAAHLCAGMKSHYELEGCEIVVSKLTELNQPMALCDTFKCEGAVTSAHTLCKQINMRANSTVAVAGYRDWVLSRTNVVSSVKLASPNAGIRVLSATYGIGETCNNTNNMLCEVTKRCESKLRCVIPSPQRADMAGGFVPSTVDGCQPAFEVTYKCGVDCDDNSTSATNSSTHTRVFPIHRLFAPENPSYDDLILDCLPEFPSLLHQPPIKPGSLMPTSANGYDDIYNVLQDMRKPTHPPRKQNITAVSDKK